MITRHQSISADILVVDDTPENVRVLSILLSQKGYNVRKALSGTMALRAVRTVMPDLILLDIMMPSMGGYEVCQRLKADEHTREIPIIFLSALGEPFDKVKAFQVGGADYITKPFQLEEVLVRIENQLILKTAKREILQFNTQLEQRIQEQTQQLEFAHQKLKCEIAERQQIQAQLFYMTLHDGLTGLPNRSLLMKCLDHTLNRAKTDPAFQFALLLLDCDRFKLINDSFGHLLGDNLLIAIAQRLTTLLGPKDTVARLGGDEFAILLTEVDSPKDVLHKTEEILESFSYPFQLDEREIFIDVSIGIVMGNADSTKSEYLLRDADTAMYHAKASTQTKYYVFDSSMHHAALRLLQLETDLRQAIKRHEFVVYYQPIVNLTTSRILGFEALARWQHPTRGLLAPTEFIPVAEETGLITQIGNWVLESACQQLYNWQRQGIADFDLSMSVNLSACQFTQPDLIDRVQAVLEKNRLHPQALKLEITESAIIDNAQSSAILRSLKEHQIELCLDDFGTGYSSLSYIQFLPIDTLKIDKSFVQRLAASSDNLDLIPAILSIANTMNLRVIAEGIETPHQLKQLQMLNCDFGQGYLFSKPVGSEEASHLIQTTFCYGT